MKKFSRIYVVCITRIAVSSKEKNIQSNNGFIRKFVKIRSSDRDQDVSTISVHKSMQKRAPSQPLQVDISKTV